VLPLPVPLALLPEVAVPPLPVFDPVTLVLPPLEFTGGLEPPAVLELPEVLPPADALVEELED
jgi:hypothetical protein